MFDKKYIYVKEFEDNVDIYLDMVLHEDIYIMINGRPPIRMSACVDER